MRIDVESIVSISEANQNFSKVARLVDERGVALILRNGAPRYVLLDYALLAGHNADEDVADAAAQEAARAQPAFTAAMAAAHPVACYCPDCRRLMVGEAGQCGDCEEPLRPPQPGDPVLLVSAGHLKAQMIASLLEDSGVPHTMESNHGVGFAMRAGPLNETYRFYVPYGAYAACHDLIASAFGEDAEIMEALQ